MYALESLRGIGVRAPTDLGEGGGGSGDLLSRKKNTHDDRMKTQIAVKTNTFTILMPNKKTVMIKKRRVVARIMSVFAREFPKLGGGAAAPRP